MEQKNKFKWALTRVWEINRKLIVAKSIEDAIKLYKLYYDEDVEIEKITAVGSSSYLAEYDAIIKAEE